MEFKGTKGNWERITIDYDLNQEVFLEDTEQSICKINSTTDLQLYDALLISKAPEMFEMLNEILISIDYNEINENKDYYKNKIQQLIKQATEL